MKPALRKRLARAPLLAAPALACQLAGVPAQDLPAEPIAMHYRTPEQARLRAEALAGAEAAGRAAATLPGVARVDALASLVSDVLGVPGAPEDPVRGRLALLDPRSGEVHVVTEALRGSVPLDWSADHTRLLFSQTLRDAVQLFELHRVRDTVRPMTHGPRSHVQGCYGPEGRIVAIETEVHGAATRSRVALSAPGGAAPFLPISEGPADHSPSCAPDGSRVAFVRETSAAAGEIWIASLPRGRPARRLAPGREPRFDPAGAWIVFSAPLRSEWRLWRMRPDGSARAPLGAGVRAEASPAPSPDGRLVAYVASETPPRRHLYVRRFDGSGDRILYAHGDAEYPVW